MLEKMLNYDLHATGNDDGVRSNGGRFLLAADRLKRLTSMEPRLTNYLSRILRGLSNGNERLHADCIKYRPSIVAKWGL